MSGVTLRPHNDQAFDDTMYEQMNRKLERSIYNVDKLQKQCLSRVLRESVILWNNVYR
jgi:hypothetical protein